MFRLDANAMPDFTPNVLVGVNTMPNFAQNVLVNVNT